VAALLYAGDLMITQLDEAWRGGEGSAAPVWPSNEIISLIPAMSEWVIFDDLGWAGLSSGQPQ